MGEQTSSVKTVMGGNFGESFFLFLHGILL